MQTEGASVAISEDDVSKAVAAWLESSGFTNVNWVPAGRQGFDISTGPSGGHPGWVIEAKGGISSKPGEKSKPYPNGSIFSGVSQAFNTAVCHRDRDDRAGREVGFAIPAGGWFDTHSKKLERACKELGITIFRVGQDGTVTVT